MFSLHFDKLSVTEEELSLFDKLSVTKEELSHFDTSIKLRTGWLSVTKLFKFNVSLSLSKTEG